MIDPMVSLAVAVHSNKGVYSLLLGSGISRASGIPTGWEVVLDLINKVAKLEGEDGGSDAAAWFRGKYGIEPDYSKLLDQLAKTPTERQQLLRSYFEPTEDERLQNLKLPSSAHRAIARLVVSGHLRVIVTTNFDRLMERAMEEVSVTPTVISSPDQVSGSLPLAHSGATIIKLHGDYLDARIKNTEAELADYDKNFDQLLDRVFDEYGLIICGWSGDWDIALRAALGRSANRRFTTYWTTRTVLSEKASILATHRRAVVLQVPDANQLFGSLEAKIQALQDLDAPHPLSSTIAAAVVKRYLVDPASRIRLYDLVQEETEKVVVKKKDSFFIPSSQISDASVLAQQLARYEAVCESLLAIIVTGAFWGDDSTTDLWVNSLQRIGNSIEFVGGAVGQPQLHRYPTLLLMYGAGMAAIAAQKYHTFSALLTNPKVINYEGKKEALCAAIYQGLVLDPRAANCLPGLEQSYIPLSVYLYQKLREPLRNYLPADDAYQETFDRLEYLLGFLFADLVRWERGAGQWWGPIGIFAFRGMIRGITGETSRQIGAEMERQGEAWPLLKAGLFDGSLVRAKETKAKFDAHVKSCR